MTTFEKLDAEFRARFATERDTPDSEPGFVKPDDAALANARLEVERHKRRLLDLPRLNPSPTRDVPDDRSDFTRDDEATGV